LQTSWTNTYGPTAAGEYADKSYWVATYSWSNQNYPYSTALYNQSGNFSTGYVPTFGIIGKNMVVYFNDSGYNATNFNAAMKAAINSFNPAAVILTNPVPDKNLLIGGQITVDVANVFTVEAGNPIAVTVNNNSNPSIASAVLNDNILTITGMAFGATEITLKGTSGSFTAIDKFYVKVKDPNAVYLVDADFGVFPPAGWTNSGWAKGDGGSIGSCAKAAYQPAGTKSLTTSAVMLPAEFTAKLDYDWKNNDISKIVGHDTTFCEITNNDGTTWTKLAVLSASSPQTAYTHVNKDLEAYKGQTIKLRWRYKTNGSSSAYGAGLDEVLLSYIGTGSINDSGSPVDFTLLQNYPNPFNPSTTISFNLQSAFSVKLAVYNQAGAEVAVITESRLNQGAHSFNFDGSKLNSGVYYYTLTANNQQKSGKMLLVK